MLLEPTDEFRSQNDDNTSKNRSFRFLYGYVKLYQKYYTQIILGLFLGCLLQLLMPFFDTGNC